MNVMELRDGTELLTFPHEVPKKPENSVVKNDF